MEILGGDPNFRNPIPMSERYELAPNQGVYAVCYTGNMDPVHTIHADPNRIFFSEADERAEREARRLCDEALNTYKLARVVRALHPIHRYFIEGFAVIGTDRVFF